jgi:hypothetical protein
VLLLIGYRGVLAIVSGQSAGSKPAVATAPTAAGPAFPVSLADAYALQFGAAYLNFSPSSAAQRAHELARFLPPGAGSQFGWNGAGTQHLLSDQVASTAVTGPHTAIVTLLASVNDGRLIELAVPVYVSHGGLSVLAEPAQLPGPPRAVPSATSPLNSDTAAESALQTQLPAFFTAYASGDRTTLARFTVPGARIESLAGAVSFGGLDDVFAPPGGARRSITVTVTWKLSSASASSRTVATAPASLQMTYQLTVLRQGTSWDVQSIGPLRQGPS